jgi:hypothetical protein
VSALKALSVAIWFYFIAEAFSLSYPISLLFD